MKEGSHSAVSSSADIMPLNYRKWDDLEVRRVSDHLRIASEHPQLSDDSDIEVHQNVDKASMIRRVLQNEYLDALS